MSETPTLLLLDGRTVEARPNELLIEVLLREAIEIPHVCYHQQLGRP